MTTDQLQQKHLQAIENYTDFVNTNKKAAAKASTKISLEFGIELLKQVSGYGKNVFLEEINNDISELKKQKEQV